MLATPYSLLAIRHSLVTIRRHKMDANDKYACAELIQAWGLYRDQGRWPELLATFVPDGQISISWFSQPHSAHGSRPSK